MHEYTDGENLHANAFLSSVDAHNEYGVRDEADLKVHEGTGDFDIEIGPGDAIIGGTDMSKSSVTTKTLSGASGQSEPRYDIVEISSSGTISVQEGTPAKNPAAQRRTAGRLVLAAIRVDVDAVSVTDSDIIDMRTIKPQVVPSGIIAIWSGLITNIPSGWVLCDGKNGTPDLRDRFIVGAGNSHTVDETGGQSTVTLTEAEIPSHDHGIRAVNDPSGAGEGGWESASFSSGRDEGVRSGGTLRDVQPSGGDSAHENKPPYHALAYIMKL